jgi:DNA polymerase-3 subunit alpha
MTTPMQFVSWHTHFTTSYGDGFGPAVTHAERVAALGMTALGLSDHGNVSGHVKHEQACAQFGLKAQFGCEVYFGPVSEDKKTQAKTHLTIFAMNDEGYHNLNKIITKSYVDAYYSPTVSWENLVKHNAGIVVFSGCSDSLLSCSLLGGKFLGPRREPEDPAALRRANLARRAERFAEVFDGRFFLEVQRFPQLPRTCAINAEFAALSSDTGIPLIATADVHYPYPHQNVMQTALHAATRGGTVATVDAEWEYDILLTYPLSDHEIHSDLIATGIPYDQAQAAIEATAELSERCNVTLPKAKPMRFPGVSSHNAILCGPKDLDKKPTENDLDHVHNMAAYLHMMGEIKKGWAYRCKQRPNLKTRSKEYSRRISMEMKVIGDKNFCDYFLIVSDLIIRAKDNDETVGPGRGSAAGSLVCYLLRITEIDPLHPLFARMVFERFIDPTRSDMPDIDIDFDDEKRANTPARARAIYGNENVGNIANHQKYRGVSALNAMAKAHFLPKSTFDPIKERITDRTETDERVDDTILDVIETFGHLPAIAELLDQHREAIELATWLEGNDQGQSVHAGGFVISHQSITEYCALYEIDSGAGSKKRRVRVIPFDKRDAEYLNMIKVDILGLTTMGMIGRVRAMTGMTLDELYALIYLEYDQGAESFDKVIDAFCADDVVGIMQYEGGTTRQVVRDVQPDNFDELAACGALSRPGPYYGGQKDAYIAVKNGEKDWERIHDTGFDRHVAWTYGQIVYQEQIMWILRDLAGFDVPRVLRVRKIIGKKLGEHQFAVLWAEFRDGCATNGVSEEQALRVWGAITTAAGYAFNTAHAYSYALIGWWQQWFKINRVTPFFGATLAKTGDGAKQINRRTAVLQDALGHKRLVGDFDLRHIEMTWSIQDGAIFPGLMQIPGVAEVTATNILEWRNALRDSGKEDKITWDAMIPPVAKGGVDRLGKITVEKIKALVASPDPLGITRTQDQLGAFRKQLAGGEFDNTPLPGEGEYHTSDELPDDDHCAWVGFVANKVFRDEAEMIRSKTGKTLEDVRSELKDPDQTKKAVLFSYDENGEVALRVNRWRYDALEPVITAIKKDHHIVVAWGKVYEGKGRSMQVKALWILDPD